jgi:aryl-alcohol dehydrogenase-like predicted oxidoreductase
MFARETFEVEYGKLFDRYRMGATTFSPLAGGLLTGKYNNGIPEGSRYANVSEFVKERYWEVLMGEKNRDKTIAKLNALADIAKEIDSSLANLAMGWVIANKDVSVCLFGASRKEQVLENTKSVETYRKFTPEILERIEKVLETRPYPGINSRDLTTLPYRR